MSVHKGIRKFLKYQHLKLIVISLTFWTGLSCSSNSSIISGPFWNFWSLSVIKQVKIIVLQLLCNVINGHTAEWLYFHYSQYFSTFVCEWSWMWRDNSFTLRMTYTLFPRAKESKHSGMEVREAEVPFLRLLNFLLFLGAFLVCLESRLNTTLSHNLIQWRTARLVDCKRRSNEK